MVLGRSDKTISVNCDGRRWVRLHWRGSPAGASPHWRGVAREPSRPGAGSLDSPGRVAQRWGTRLVTTPTGPSGKVPRRESYPRSKRRVVVDRA